MSALRSSMRLGSRALQTFRLRSSSSLVRAFSAKPSPKPAAVFPEGSIYTKTSENDIFRDVKFPTEDGNKHANAKWRAVINELFEQHRPSKHTFFVTLKNAPPSVVKNPGWLNEFYLRYQAAMHATRAAVYNAPYLNTPTLRQRRIAIISDDDTPGDKLSHHQQLENMFRRFGGNPIHSDNFGDAEPLIAMVDPQTGAFVRTADTLYRKSTGAWCIAEVLSDDWLSALADSFSPFFPFVMEEQYFDEIFTGHVEIIHMLETVSLTEDILSRYPHMLEPTIQHAREMAKTLDALWTNLEGLVKNPTPYLSK